MDWICLILVIIGGLNWLLVGLFDFDLVEGIFGAMSTPAKIVYILVGVATLYVLILLMPKLGKKKKVAAPAQSKDSEPA
ncbi:MAG TPA: DUF378 domain-containing protein [Candidatus Saccharicenans sp.]|jgi:uncharacterized membrane protein YuzA (DUF378 family)|nr:DUF378 domain-containing protein [Candidatus Saccharicenans sp.]HRD02167.1 DUF378 domain-containing protein [Candidatus Saccharicenans sp.]